MSDDSDDRNHPATPGRRQEAWLRGSAARSFELNLAVAGLATGLVMWWTVPHAVGAVRELARQAWGEPWSGPPTIEGLASIVAPLVQAAAEVLLPLLGAGWIAAAAAEQRQAGTPWTWDRVLPDVDRLDPWTGLGRLGSTAAWGAAAAGAVKAALFFGVGSLLLWDDVLRILDMNLASADPAIVAARLGETAAQAILKLSGLLLFIGLADYGVRRWRWERSLRMTDQELRDEMRGMQADPLVVAARQERGRARPRPTPVPKESVQGAA